MAQYFQTFDDGTLGQPYPGFTTKISRSGDAVNIQNDAILGRKFLQLFKGGTQGSLAVGWDSLNGAQDVEQLVLFKMNGAVPTTGRYGILLNRYDGSSEATTRGFAVTFTPASSTPSIIISEDSVGTVHFISYPWENNQLYWARFRVNGSTESFKIWKYGDDEPTAWTLSGTFTSSTIASPYSGLGNFQAWSNMLVYQLSAGTNGDVAPKTDPVIPTSTPQGVFGAGFGAPMGWGGMFGGSTIPAFTTVSRDQLGASRVGVVPSRNQGGNTRVTSSVLRHQSGRVRVTRSESRLQTGRVRVRKTVTRTITGRVRIQISSTRNQIGVSRIQREVGANQLGNLSVRTTQDRPQAGNSRVQRQMTRDQQGNAFIESPFIAYLQDQSGRVSIRKDTTRTNLGRVRVQRQEQSSQTGRTRVQRIILSPLFGNIRVERTEPKDQIGSVSILKDKDKYQQGNARVQLITLRTLLANTRISKSASYTQLGRVRITIETLRSISGNLSVKRQPLRNQPASALIAKEMLADQQGSAWIIRVNEYVDVPRIGIHPQYGGQPGVVNDRGVTEINVANPRVGRVADRPRVNVVNTRPRARQ